ncbi:MAG TPA: metalloregulator ArsR/SmtB family transcription factor, partial [Nocardioidaceae bacterium]|nr:metalloregulator ArsR/SmtB family transcription factor [Nocardioidaceae bacterium]
SWARETGMVELQIFAIRKIFMFNWIHSRSQEAGHGMPVPLYQAKAEFFKTLGHPARIRILELLSERDHAVHELLEKIAIEPSSLSQQLAVLRRTSLVVSHRSGGEVVYSVSVPEVRDLLLAARSILSGIISQQGELKAELTQSA